MRIQDRAASRGEFFLGEEFPKLLALLRPAIVSLVESAVDSAPTDVFDEVFLILDGGLFSGTLKLLDDANGANVRLGLRFCPALADLVGLGDEVVRVGYNAGTPYSSLISIWLRWPLSSAFFAAFSSVPFASISFARFGSLDVRLSTIPLPIDPRTIPSFTSVAGFRTSGAVAHIVGFGFILLYGRTLEVFCKPRVDFRPIGRGVHGRINGDVGPHKLCE